MVKQKKLIKLMLFVLMLIPLILLLTGIVQTFVLKSKQQQLLNAQNELTLSQQELLKQQQIYNYQSSDEYKEENFKHNEYNGQNYGNKGDVNVEIKNN